MSKKLSTMIDKVHVLGFTADVEFVEELVEDGDQCYGCYYPARDLIKILHGDGVSHEKQLATLIHEIFELIVDKMEMGTKHRDITTLESAIFTVFRHNPELSRAFSLYAPKEVLEVKDEC